MQQDSSKVCLSERVAQVGPRPLVEGGSECGLHPLLSASKAVHYHPNPVCRVGTELMPALELQCSTDMQMTPGDLSSMPGSQEELRELVRTCSPGFLLLSSFPCSPPILFAFSLHLPQPLTRFFMKSLVKTWHPVWSRRQDCVTQACWSQEGLRISPSL